MSSLFKKLNQFSYNRENAIKESLLNTLNENAKEIQFEFKENGRDVLELVDCTNSLCTTLEAIFLHGLKDSFLWQTINVISNDVDRRPEPSFWSPLLIFLHKQVIEQIQSLSQITTEIGCCRSWIRLSLNESLLSSYLNNIRKNSSALNPYYKKYALLKDGDNLEVVSKILEGIESCIQINLPINSSLLNHWGNYALQLAGIWSPPLRSCPIASGIDVASSITDNVVIPTPKPISEFFTESISNSPLFNQSILQPSTSDLTESEHLQVLLQKVDEIDKIPEEDSCQEVKVEFDQKENQTNDIKKSAIITSPITTTENVQIKDEIIGNSVSLLTGWSNPINDDNTTNNNNFTHNSTNNNNSSNNDVAVTTTKTTATPSAGVESKLSFNRSDSMTNSISSLRSPIDRHSFNTLLVRHERTRELNWTDVWARFEYSLRIAAGVGGSNGGDNTTIEGSESEHTIDDRINPDDIENYDFEILSPTITEKFTVQELHQMVEQLCKLAREPGLDVQGFVCKSCSYPLGIGFTPAQVCAFSGNYFCDNCMNVHHFMIPAKIIYNWDFRKYSVSKRAATFLMEFQLQPFIDLKLLNPDIYRACKEMCELKSLRIRLNFIRAYLFTCRESVIEDLQKQVWYKDYLYEHIHQYSIADLTMIPKGTLAQLLQKTFAFGEQHILNCRLCKVKGFICEICNSPKVLYPFHVDTTYRCQLCGAVFHAHCLNDSQPCPKCERKRKREDLPLYEAVHML